MTLLVEMTIIDTEPYTKAEIRTNHTNKNFTKIIGFDPHEPDA